MGILVFMLCVDANIGDKEGAVKTLRDFKPLKLLNAAGCEAYVDQRSSVLGQLMQYHTYLSSTSTTQAELLTQTKRPLLAKLSR